MTEVTNDSQASGSEKPKSPAEILLDSLPPVDNKLPKRSKKGLGDVYRSISSTLVSIFTVIGNLAEAGEIASEQTIRNAEWYRAQQAQEMCTEAGILLEGKPLDPWVALEYQRRLSATSK